MSLVRFAVLASCLVASSAAFAQAERPRSIFEALFGRRSAPVETPTLLAPPPSSSTVRSNSFVPPKAAVRERLAQPKHAKRPTKEKTEVVASFIDPQPRASASYNGPFRGGGNQPVCVRLCDGYFFPVNYEGAKGNDRYEEACQASCPGTKTEVYFMPRGADLTSAATARGQRYAALENAFRYRKQRDPACTCKAPNQSWGNVLQNADSLVRRHKNDIIVTDDKLVGPPAPAALEVPAGKQDAPKPLAQAAIRYPFDPMVPMPAILPSPPEARSELLRSLFGESTGRTSRFLKIDPIETGSIRQTLH